LSAGRSTLIAGHLKLQQQFLQAVSGSSTQVLSDVPIEAAGQVPDSMGPKSLGSNHLVLPIEITRGVNPQS